MKTAILTFALMILMTAANARTLTDSTNSPFIADQAFNAMVNHPDANIIKFSVNNPDEEKVILKIYNDEMVKIFHRNLKSEKEVSIKCDLSNCGSGTYTCIVKRNGIEEVRKVITLN